jgi:hypothetical protein
VKSRETGVRPCKHLPDHLLITDTGPVVVDVKPARRLADPKVAPHVWSGQCQRMVNVSAERKKPRGPVPPAWVQVSPSLADVQVTVSPDRSVAVTLWP